MLAAAVVGNTKHGDTSANSSLICAAPSRNRFSLACLVNGEDVALGFFYMILHVDRNGRAHRHLKRKAKILANKI
jgi:hypothetical protein